MNSEVLFSENQRFRQWWLWAILLGTNGLMLFGVTKQLILGQPFGDHPAGDTELVMITAITLLLTLLFVSLKLETRITKDGVYFRFTPFHRSFRAYTWDKLLKSYVRKYSPIMEYGGWGLRYGFFGKGNAFNVSGNMGLQLETNEHKKILIGTRKPEELTETLRKIRQLKD
jgi:hypothetical protein